MSAEAPARVLEGRTALVTGSSRNLGAAIVHGLAERGARVAVNYRGAERAAQAVAPAMRRGGWGRIVMISAGSRYLRNHSIYGLAKDALVFLAEELAVELAPEVTVNAVAPGQIAESAQDMEAFDPGFVERATAATPAGRLVTRGEVADVVAFLCGPAGAMVTGVTVPIDGGWRLRRA